MSREYFIIMVYCLVCEHYQVVIAEHVAVHQRQRLDQVLSDLVGSAQTIVVADHLFQRVAGSHPRCDLTDDVQSPAGYIGPEGP